MNGSILCTCTKTKSAKSIYTLDWEKWLNGDTIDDSSWSLSGDGLVAESISHTTTTTTIKIGGGSTGKEYMVTNKISTDDGSVDDKSFYLRVVD